MTDRIKAPLAEEDGSILVLSAFLLIVLLALAAFAVDLTMQSSDRQQLWNSADAAALAGAALLPDGVAAENQAEDTALANDDDLVGSNLLTTFRCLVADKDGNGVPDFGEVGPSGACNPVVGITQGIPTAIPPIPGGWTCANNVCTAVCIPAVGDTCNTIVLATQATTDFAFGGAVGIDSGETQIRSAACRGTCGAGLTGPVDLILVLDRSGSMTDADMQRVEDASLAMLGFFDPMIQKVGLAVLPATDGDLCGNASPQSGGRWLAVPLSDDYKKDTDGDGIADTVDTVTSELGRVIVCSNDDGSTNLGSPIRDLAGVTTLTGDDAMSELLNNGRPGVKKGIVFLSDGGANQPGVPNPCEYAWQQAEAAKDQDIEIYTIGYGVDDPDAPGRSVFCDKDQTGPYGEVLFPDPDPTKTGAPVTRLLADMASGNAGDDCTATTTDVENTDGDFFFCVPLGSDLDTVFLTIAAELAQGSRLVQLPPGA